MLQQRIKTLQKNLKSMAINFNYDYNYTIIILRFSYLLISLLLTQTDNGNSLHPQTQHGVILQALTGRQ
jgi:hypothetical protein